MGKITINLTKRDIPDDFQGKFNGKTYEVKLKDAVLKPDTDDLKTPSDVKNGEKLAAMIKAFVKPFKDSVESLLDEATITSDVTGLGDHELEIKFKGSKSPSATLQFRDKDGNLTRVVVVEEEHDESWKENWADRVSYANSTVEELCNDDKIQKKIKSLALSPGDSGHGKTVALGGGVVHCHVTNNDGIAYKWNKENLIVVAWGQKSDSAGSGTSGYEWVTG